MPRAKGRRCAPGPPRAWHVPARAVRMSVMQSRGRKRLCLVGGGCVEVRAVFKEAERQEGPNQAASDVDFERTALAVLL